VRRHLFPQIFRFAALSTFIAGAFVVAVSSSLASDVPVTTDDGGTLLTPAGCKGALLALYPGTPAPFFSHDDTPFQRGVYVTAIKDFAVCSMGCRIQVTGLPQTLNAYIYAANGTTRGALVFCRDE
jgi:hypothetical protein